MTMRGWEDYVPPPHRVRRQSLPYTVVGKIDTPLPLTPKRGKYGAQKTGVLPDLRLVEPGTPGALVFDSKREAERYVALRMQLRSGAIEGLELQPRFVLHVVGPDGVKVPIGSYIADFRFRQAGRDVIEDVKGFAGKELYVWKKRHVQAEYGIAIVEV